MGDNRRSNKLHISEGHNIKVSWLALWLPHLEHFRILKTSQTVLNVAVNVLIDSWIVVSLQINAVFTWGERLILCNTNQYNYLIIFKHNVGDSSCKYIKLNKNFELARFLKFRYFTQWTIFGMLGVACDKCCFYYHSKLTKVNLVHFCLSCYFIAIPYVICQEISQKIGYSFLS